MSGEAPAWMLYLATGIGASVLVYCLWTGKVGTRSGSTITRAKNPPVYWISILALVVMTYVLLKHSLAR